MVLRTFGAFDNEAFTVDPGSPFMTPGSPVINNSSTPVGTIFTYQAGFPSQQITLDDSSSNPDLFNDDDEDNHVITDGGTLVANGTEVESESYHYLRLLDENGIPTGPRITITVFSQNGQTSNIWGMASDSPLIPGARYVKVGGSNNGTSLYDSFVPCFTSGTRIVTPSGERPVEALRVGDRVVTRDNGLQRVRWIGRRQLAGAALRADPGKRPILIRKGAMGNGLPERDIALSPNHRLLLARAGTEMLYGAHEVLAAAKDLTARPGIGRAEPPAGVTYVHMMFDRHEVVMSNGIWSESFLPGEMAMDGLDRAQQREILCLFPELATTPRKAAFRPARRILRRYEAELLC